MLQASPALLNILFFTMTRYVLVASAYISLASYCTARLNRTWAQGEETHTLQNIKQTKKPSLTEYVRSRFICSLSEFCSLCLHNSLSFLPASFALSRAYMKTACHYARTEGTTTHRTSSRYLFSTWTFTSYTSGACTATSVYAIQF